jgi:hypothetical protein
VISYQPKVVPPRPVPVTPSAPSASNANAGVEIVGVKNARVEQIITYGSAPHDPITVTTLDTTTYSDGAVLLLTNNAGHGVYVSDVGIIGKRVLRASGESGFIHDSFVDWDRVEAEGEIPMEVGNNFIITATQVRQIADWLWKYNSAVRHLYRVQLPGTWFQLCPGETYTLQIGGAGQKEYIDATVRVVSVDTERDAGGLGSTIVVFREVMQNWTFDSSAIARYRASQDYARLSGLREVVVASSGYVGRADYFCDGTDDQTEINLAIAAVSTLTGGGFVKLVGDTFYVTAAIEMQSNVLLDGGKCTIEKNCNDYAIEAVGTSGTHLSNIIVRDMTVTRDTADTNALKAGIYAEYVDDVVVEKVTFDSLIIGVWVKYSTGRISQNVVTGACGSGTHGIRVDDSYGMFVYDNVVRDVTANAGYVGIAYNTAAPYNIYGGNIGRNTIRNVAMGLTTTDLAGDGYRGIEISAGSAVGISDNSAEDCWYYTDSLPGIAQLIVSNTAGAIVARNLCRNNGNLLNRGNCESTSPPSMIGESTAVKTSCTFTRSTDFAHNGTYSYKMSKTAAPGTAARVDLADSTAANDLHGAVVGTGHTHMGYVMIPSVNGPLASEVSIVLQDTTAGAWSSTAIFATTDYYDQWQAVQVTRTIGTTCAAGGFLPSLAIASAASSSEYVYWDDLRVRPDGVHNEYSQNYSDAGTVTQAVSNSWQSPFPA